ncbi:PIF1-like helicase-domain-containing protein, partial [Schizophyllum commune]
MPQPGQAWVLHADNRLIAEQLDFDRGDERLAAIAGVERVRTNPHQTAAFDEIMGCIWNHNPGIFFVNGPGGTGKTFLYNTIAHVLRADARIVLCSASSGIAALLLRGGRTAHSTFKIPIITLSDASTCSFSKSSARADLLRAADLIIWDEVLMQHRYTVETLERTLRDICSSTVVFGGKVVL